MSLKRHQTSDPAAPAVRKRERDPLANSSAFDPDDSVPPLDQSQAPLGTHEVPPDDQTKIESPAAKHRTPPPRVKGPASTPPPAPAPKKERGADRLNTVLGSYRLLELIGKGGMGYVYRAEHTKLGREVALKVLRIDYARRRDSVARFFQEARTVNRIRHRNIIDVTDFVELDDGTTFIIMELLRGKSLGRWAKDHVDVPRTLAILVQICDGLAAAHAVGVIHRDLKPDNVIIVPTGDGAEQVKLLDFGVAKLVHRDDEDFGLETAAGSVIGTPAYMSPEQAGGLVVDARSDIYSLGAIMYELFCGQPMFRGRSFGEYVRKHLQESPVPPRETARGAELDPRLEDILLRCIDKDPERRYPTIDALRDDLLATLGGIETMDPGRVMPLPAPKESGVVVPSIALLATQPPIRHTPTLEPTPITLPPTRIAAPAPKAWVWVLVAGAATGVGIAAFMLSREPTRSTRPESPAVRPESPAVRPERSASEASAQSKGAPEQPPPVTVEPAKLPLITLTVRSTPAADVYEDDSLRCATPCNLAIDPNTGRTDLRTLTFHRDGYRDRAVDVKLATPPPEIAVSLDRDRAAGRSHPPRSTTHHATPSPTTAHDDTTLMTPDPTPTPTPPTPPKPKGKGKVDSTTTIDPFAP